MLTNDFIDKYEETTNFPAQDSTSSVGDPCNGVTCGGGSYGDVGVVIDDPTLNSFESYNCRNCTHQKVEDNEAGADRCLCTLGEYRPPPGDACLLCPPGKFSHDMPTGTEANECSTCDTGRFTGETPGQTSCQHYCFPRNYKLSDVAYGTGHWADSVCI